MVVVLSRAQLHSEVDNFGSETEKSSSVTPGGVTQMTSHFWGFGVGLILVFLLRLAESSDLCTLFSFAPLFCPILSQSPLIYNGQVSVRPFSVEFRVFPLRFSFLFHHPIYVQ